MTSSENPHDSSTDPLKNANWLVARSILAKEGYSPEPPESVDDLTLRGRLWELIYAMAARGFYLACTDHLSDRELHRWLHDHWLNEAAADLPPNSEWHARISPVSSSTEEEGTLIWLRYYADDAERGQFAPDEIPPHEDPRHDRDRFLPDAPLSCCGIFGCQDDGEFAEADAGDALPCDDELLPFSGEQEDGACDFEQQEIFALSCSDEDDAMEEKNWQQPLKVLRREGVLLLPPDEHTDETISAGLWELLHELACRGFYVLHTDHLADRELYTALWKDSLREPAMLSDRNVVGGWFHDFLGNGSEESEELYLRFYASEHERAKSQLKHPERPVPAHEEPVAHRDWRLPRGPI